MRHALKATTFLCAVLAGRAFAVPPPCTEEELLSTSDFAIEGYVVDVECSEPHDTGECTADPPVPADFLPELASDCTATVKVTLSLKGDHAPGEEVAIPFLELVRDCVDAPHIVPGTPKNDFRLNSKVRYFNSPSCAWSNFFELETPFLRGDPGADGNVDIADAVYILLRLFAGAPAPTNPSALDGNADGSIDLADAVYLLEYLFRGGPAPPDPFRWEKPGVRITVGYDNYGYLPDMETHWGFSCVIETPEHTLLVDAGEKGDLLLRNMGRLGMDLLQIDVALFTHIHKDHVNGLPSILDRTRDIPVFLPQSFTKDIREQVTSFDCTVIDVTGPVEVCPGVLSSGEIQSSPQEQFLNIETGKGLVVLTSCAHPGILPIVEEARRQTGKEVYMVLGGYHLFQMDDAELQSVISEFRRLGVKKVGPCHCSGDRTRQLFKEEYGKDYIEFGAGTVLSWSP
jgi:7,8-dihydropterin-6-yl-methyl-4-(beta-D-ribofuranosyl)aminobenzene 5'-phosphate synthase